MIVRNTRSDDGVKNEIEFGRFFYKCGGFDCETILRRTNHF